MSNDELVSFVDGTIFEEMAKAAIKSDIKSAQDVFAEANSAHQTIRLKMAVDAIDTALLRHIPDELLTPMFAKRAIKIQKTSQSSPRSSCLF